MGCAFRSLRGTATTLARFVGPLQHWQNTQNHNKHKLRRRLIVPTQKMPPRARGSGAKKRWKSQGEEGLIMKAHYEGGRWKEGMEIDEYRDKIYSKSPELQFQANHESFRNAKKWWNWYKEHNNLRGANRPSTYTRLGCRVLFMCLVSNDV